jgi:hypothetical protein
MGGKVYMSGKKEDWSVEDDPETQASIETAAGSEFKRLVAKLKADAESAKKEEECPKLPS